MRGGGMFSATRNRVPWSVVLKNVPATVTERQILDSVPVKFGPRHVEMSDTKNSMDADTIQALVESFLASIGQANVKIVPTLAGKRTKARAVFENEDDAIAAVDTLKDKTPQALKEAGLMAHLVASASLKISKNVHEKIKSEIEALRKTAAPKHVKVKEFADAIAGRFVTLKIEGEQLADVKVIVGQLEQSTSGAVIMDQEAPFWSPSLALPGIRHRLKQIESSFGVVIIRDPPKRQLRVIGASDRIEEVCTAVVARFGKDAVEMHSISLSHDQFLWACRGGFAQITAALGKGVASLDVTRTPKTISLTGSLDDYHRVLSLIQGKEDSVRPNTEAVEGDCAICYTEAEQPVITACGQRYCLDCFENMCKYAASSTNESGVTCQGDTGSCGTVLPLKMLQESLSSPAFEEVLASSFHAHIQHRPAEYRYCPTPDCGNVYRASEVATGHACTECFTVVCTACHNQHATMSCADYKDLQSGGFAAFEKLKKELNIKDCPKCSTPIEKTYGCNHMECAGCGAHICWVCMQTFQSGGGLTHPIYNHMNLAHGGIGFE